MTDDAALVAFLEAARAPRAKVVMVGDPHQLSSVAPGGGFEALVERWGGDVAAGSDAAMYTWRRATVAALNRIGRQVWAELGRLSSPELVVGDVGYRAGDRIVTLAPGAGGKVVTSECATVIAVDVARRELAARMDDDGRIHAFEPDDIEPSRMAHAYAITVHRSQGATVQRVHVLEDGGGRELAYVKMSRARGHTTVHVVADSLEQAVEDLAKSWAQSRRIGWAIDAGTPAPERSGHQRRRSDTRDLAPSVRYGRLVAEREALLAAVPTDPGYDACEGAKRRVERLHQQLRDLDADEGWGVLRKTPVGEAAREWSQAVQRHRSCLYRAEHAGFRERRQLRREADQALQQEPALRERFERLAAAERQRITTELPEAEREVSDLDAEQRAFRHWEHAHPEIYRRLDRLDREIAKTRYELDRSRERLDGVAAGLPEFMRPGRHLRRDGLELDRGIDFGW